MEIIYQKTTARVHRRDTTSYENLQVFAIGYYDGCTLYFGGFEGKIDCVFEAQTGIRCCDYQKFPKKYSEEDCVEALMKLIYDQVQRAGVSFHEVRDRWYWIHEFHRPKQDYMIPLWRISLLIG